MLVTTAWRASALSLGTMYRQVVIDPQSRQLVIAPAARTKNHASLSILLCKMIGVKVVPPRLY